MGYDKRWKNILWLVLTLSAVLLTGLLVVLFVKVARDRQQEIPGQTQESTEESSQSEASEEESATEETEPESTVPEEEEEQQGYIIIGDSHAVVTDGQGYSIYGSGVEGVVLNRNLFIVHTWLDPVMGTIEWLKGDGTDRMKEIMEEHPEISEWNIISMHGTSMVLVPGIGEQYVEHYRNWMDETFPGCGVYIVSVPPLDEDEWVVRHPDAPARSNQDIVNLNARMAQAFPDQYFDYYDWFLEHDDFQDEIHYTGETYRMLFDEIIGNIRQKK